MRVIAGNISIPLRSASVTRITGWKHKDFESKRRKVVGWILEETRKFWTCSQVELLFCIGKSISHNLYHWIQVVVDNMVERPVESFEYTHSHLVNSLIW